MPTTVTRFLRRQKDYSPSKGLVKRRAFMPAPDGAVSTFDVDELSAEEVWQLAIEHVEPKRGRIDARGDLLASFIAGIDLLLVPDDDPPRHVSLVGWPDEKEDQLLKANQLATEADLVQR